MIPTGVNPWFSS